MFRAFLSSPRRARSRRAAAALALLAGASVSACTPLKPRDDMPLEDELEATEPIASLARSSAANWSCLDSYGLESTLIPNAVDADQWAYTRQVVSYVDGAPIPELAVRVCQLADVDCQRPLATAGPADEEGWFTVPVPDGFSGYFEFTAQSFMPGLWFHGRLAPDKRSFQYPVSLLDLEAAEEFSVAVGTPLDPTLGIIFMYVFDCNGVPAEGLQFRSDQADNPWYVVNGIPNFTTRATSPQGVGGFANVPPGVALVQSSFGDGTPLGRPQAVYVRPGWGTVVIIDPSGSAPQVASP